MNFGVLAKGPVWALCWQTRYGSEASPCQIRTIGISPADDAKGEIRAAVGYLLRNTTGGGARGDIVQEIIAIVRQVASGLPPEQPDPLDDGLPGG